MLALQAQDLQRSYLMAPSPYQHPYYTHGTYNTTNSTYANHYTNSVLSDNHYANNLANANHYADQVTHAAYDEDLYSSEFTPEITPRATPDIEPAELFSPYFSFDIRSPSASPVLQNAIPCSPRTTGASLHSPLTQYHRSPLSESHPLSPPLHSPLSPPLIARHSPTTTTFAPPPPSPPPPSSPATCGRISSTSVEQALEIARESREGAADPTVQRILEHALAETWARVELMQGAYLMTRVEFSVFNFFQDRFAGNGLAVLARRRYWEGTTGRS